ncbi:MAG: HD domain-containing protein [Lachnospiraceae bacterium]|nr:HD domain-containing protein [Lachnospiraceae bacterium]
MNNDKEKFDEELTLLLQDPNICQMENFPQHKSSNTLKHSVSVAKLSFSLAEKFGWDISEAELVKGALLHDYYLYNARTEDISGYSHGISHPETALRNAMKDFDLTGKEKNIIRGHMWPLTLFSPPRSKEAILVCIADKYVAAKEMSFKKNKKTYFYRRNGRKGRSHTRG